MSARVEGFPLVRHNVFFSRDSRAEFDDLFARARLPRGPHRVCLRPGSRRRRRRGAIRARALLLIVNAPARPASRPLAAAEIETCQIAAFRRLERCGLTIEQDLKTMVRTTPEEFARAYPSTRGALYGPATHGWKSTFAREGATTRLPGLYLAGGSVHPGPGAPMAALSGRQAALRATRDLASTGRSVPAAMRGDMSTR